MEGNRRKNPVLKRRRDFFLWVLRHGLCSMGVAVCLFRLATAQDLAPRSYIITPIHSNAVILTYSLFDGNLDFQGAVPIADATARANVPILAIYHSFNMFGRTANVTAGLSYGEGHFQGTVLDTQTNVYRSGLLDSVYRVSTNLIGGPAMAAPEFRKWHQKNILGVSLRVIAPTGQYDSTKLINLGNNRWGFKPEVGYSRRNGHWILDTYFGTWFYTKNPKFFSENQYYPGVQSQTQAPVGAFEGHVSYDVRPRFWVSFDANFWFGGETSLNGVANPDTELRSSRLGGTASVPISKHQSIKVSYSDGAYIRYGGNFQNVSVAWQYSWLGRPN
jgi:Putative MetA-pathway of phenol degradation